MSKTILSIQSSVAYGHVGNSAAVFAMQRLGCDVLRLDTVAFSNHPAHGGFRGRPVPAEVLAELAEGLDERGFLGRCDAVLTGYLGLASNGNVVAGAVARSRTRNPAACYCCDPVMGDRPHGLYVAADIPACFRDRLVPAADIVTPNLFELELLTGQSIGDQPAAIVAARDLLRRGPSLVVVTGLPRDGGIDVLGVREDGVWLAGTPRVRAPAFGTGDAFTAIFLARYLEKPDVARALTLTVSAIYAIMQVTAETGADELRLIAAQDAILAPPRLFPAERVA
jgi:pyridoxine kinase